MKKETILFGLMLMLIQIAGIAYATMSIQAKVESLGDNILLTGESIYLLVNVYGNNNEYAGIQAELNLSNTTIVNIDETKGGLIRDMILIRNIMDRTATSEIRRREIYFIPIGYFMLTIVQV